MHCKGARLVTLLEKRARSTPYVSHDALPLLWLLLPLLQSDVLDSSAQEITDLRGVHLRRDVHLRRIFHAILVGFGKLAIDCLFWRHRFALKVEVQV